VNKLARIPDANENNKNIAPEGVEEAINDMRNASKNVIDNENIILKFKNLLPKKFHEQIDNKGAILMDGFVDGNYIEVHNTLESYSKRDINNFVDTINDIEYLEAVKTFNNLGTMVVSELISRNFYKANRDNIVDLSKDESVLNAIKEINNKSCSDLILLSVNKKEELIKLASAE